MEAKERRGAPRIAVETPCKVYHPATRRFSPARTTNVSETGALLRIQSDRALAPGERIDLAVSWTDRPVLIAGTMIRTRVVRTTDGTGTKAVAVEFCQPMALTLAV